MSIANLDQILDDDLFVVTDGANGTKSVTGAQFKALLLSTRSTPTESIEEKVAKV